MSTFHKVFGSRRSMTIYVRAKEEVPSESVQEQVRLVMRVRHKLDFEQPDNFSIVTDE